jgi:ribonuclease BN (tRNA processing enzyme)
VAVAAAGKLALLDLGAGTLRSMLQWGLNFNQIDLLALSHRHPDHVGDLVPFLFATRYALGYTRREPFWLLAAQGVKEVLGRLRAAFGAWLEPPEGLMQLRELSPEGED